MKIFEPFRLDPVNQCLWGQDGRIALAPKTFAVLQYLVEHPGRLVSQEELLEALWPETYVQPEVLRTYIQDLRKALGDQASQPRFIRTFPKRGYEFLPAVAEERPAPEIRPTITWEKSPAGREAPLAEIHGHFQKILQGLRQVTCVTGEAGIGKSTLVDAFERGVRSEPGVRVARGQCIEGFGGKEAYYPVLEALGQMLRGPTAEPLIRTLALRAPTWMIQFPALLKAGEREALQREIFGATRERMVREICEALEVLAAEHPLVLIVEDLQWADHSTLDLISAVARRRGPAKLMLVGTYRTTEVLLSKSPLKVLKQDLLMRGLCNEIALPGLTEPGVEQYLAAQFPHASLPAEFVRMLRRHSGGNPMFLGAILQELIKTGLLRQNTGHWALTVSPASIDMGVPETLNQMLDLQIEQLDPQEQRTLKCGSVAGQRFSAWAVSSMLDMNLGAVEQVCEDLGRRQQFIQPGGPHAATGAELSAHYEFRHSLYREALYRQLAPALRAEFHRTLAQRIETLFSSARGEASGELASELAVHFEHARDHQRAAHYLLLSADNANRRFAHRDAVQSLAHALDLLARVPTEAARKLEIAVLERLSDAHYAMGEMKESADADRKAVDLAETAGMKTAQINALTRLARPLAFLDPDGCVAVCQRAEQICATHDDPLLYARARMLAACWRVVNNGWTPEDSRICAEADAAIRRFQEQDQRAHHQPAYYEILYAHVQTIQGDYLEALKTVDAGLPRQVETHSLVVYLSALSSKTLALLHLGRWGELRRVSQTAIDMAGKNGNLPWQGIFRAILAWLNVLAGNLQDARGLAEDLLQTHSREPLGQVGTMALLTTCFIDVQTDNAARAVEHFLKARNRAPHPKFFLQWYWKTVAQYGLATAYFALNDLERAETEANMLLESVLPTADPALKAFAWEIAARIALVSGDTARAGECSQQALEALHPVAPPHAAWRAHWTRAMVCRAAGGLDAASLHHSRARAILRELADSFEPGDPPRASLLEMAAKDL